MRQAIHTLKKVLYFPLAAYFRFFAQIQLMFWKPRIIVITGSSGKTTTLQLLKSQLGDRVKYSDNANSSFGIPFDILGFKRKTLKFYEWFYLFLFAPLRAFKTPLSRKIYIVEADCDRPGEGNFLATFLKPELTCWLVSHRSHSANFSGDIDQNVAFEFGSFLENTSTQVVINGDSGLIRNQLYRTKAQIKIISGGSLQSYAINSTSSQFKISGQDFRFNYLLPEETFYQIKAVEEIVNYLGFDFDPKFPNLVLPPGRNSLFEGIKNTRIIDSSYNADLGSMTVMIKMFDALPGGKKWVVLGDMVEQGSVEEEEHQKLAEALNKSRFDTIVLIGPRLKKYTYPNIEKRGVIVESFINPSEGLKFLQDNLDGGEVILFKGGRFLEGVIEHLLKDKSDVSKLCRREQVWVQRRKRWGI